MASDPAFLFYSQDFFLGTSTLTFEDRGKFITILCVMHQKGRLTEETISFIVGNISFNLKSKFSIDENGLWFNKRLEIETEKRNKFTESRRSNGLLGGRGNKKEKASAKPNAKHKGNLMEDENEDENVIKIESIISSWNNFAETNNKSKWQKTTPARSKKLKTRINDKDFDIVKILEQASKSKFLKSSSFFTLDWIIENDTNYQKVLEGKYTDSNTKEHPLPKISKQEQNQEDLSRMCEYSHPQRGNFTGTYRHFLHLNSNGNSYDFIRFIDDAK